MSIVKAMDVLLEEEKRLHKIIRDTGKRIRQAPEGNVRIVKHGNGVQFFHRTDACDTSGHYIPVAEHDKAVKLMQKKYDQKICAAAEEQASVITYFLKKYDPEVLRRIYASQSEIRKTYIFPVDLPDKEFIKNWQSMEYEHKPFPEGASEHYSSRGERVRSKSEVIIADALYHAGIPYRYECALELDGRIIHPDFTILKVADRREIYWEHLGMMDDPDYCSTALQRIRSYEASNIYPGKDLILTMETRSVPINLMIISRMISQYCI